MTKRRYKVEIYRDIVHLGRWRVRAPNGNIVACCGEGYSTTGKALRAFLKLAKVLGWSRYKIDYV